MEYVVTAQKDRYSHGGGVLIMCKPHLLVMLLTVQITVYIAYLAVILIKQFGEFLSFRQI